MHLASALLLLLSIGLMSFAPGFLVVRRIRRWGPLEKLAASFGLSLVLLYLVAFAIYVTGLPWEITWGFTAVSCLGLVWARDDLGRLLGVRNVRLVLRAFAGLFAWNVLMLLVIRHYGGGWWGADWYEHYERSLFFIERWPPGYEFIDRYLLPARPPLLNLVAAYFLAQAGSTFSNFQLAFTFLNVLPYVPLVLLSSLLVRGRTRSAGLLALLLACNPMFLHNAQFTWTKSASAFFVTLALWFYLVGLRRQDPLRIFIAFGSLAAATLVHYSGAPFAIALGLHYLLWEVWRRRRPFIELAGAVALPSALLATWVGYSLSTYGLQDTLAANTSVTDAREMTVAENLVKVAANIGDTFVPHVMRGIWIERDGAVYRQVVDNAFMLYQVNLPFMFGLSGCAAVLFLIVRTAKRSDRGLRDERVFWAFFVVASIVIGIAVHGARDVYGLGHIGLQPLVQVGLAWVAASAALIPPFLGRFMIGAMVVDFGFGVAARVGLETILAAWAVDYNLELKEKAGVVYLGDWMPSLSLPLQFAIWIVAIVLIVRIQRLLRRARYSDRFLFPELRRSA